MASMASKTCFYTFLYSSVILVFMWPLYIYLITKWYSHRDHFVIRNRWPKISLIIVASTVLIQLLTMVEALLCISTLSDLSVGISNAVGGLVFYRSYLLYAQTMKTRKYLNTMESNNRTMIIQNENTGYYQTFGRIILCTVLLASILISVCRYLDVWSSPVTYTGFTVTTVIGVLCLVNIICKKVTDSIGITRECLLQIIINFAMLLCGNLLQSLVPSYINIAIWLGFLTSILFGFFTLFIGYNMIRKANRGKPTNIAQVIPNMSPSSPAPRRLGSESVAEQHHSTGLSVGTHSQDNTSISQMPALRDARSLAKWLHKPLALFLHDNIINLTLFIGYLSECFALENMLFLERAIILHHLIQKYQTMDHDHDSEDEMQIKPAFAIQCYKLKFTFLTQIYADIEAMIENGSKDTAQNDEWSMKYKRGIVEAMKSIYGQFCCSESDTEINVAFDVRNQLCGLFERKTDSELLAHFTSYEDLLMVYHDAIVQCWYMCDSIYGFQFKSYLRRQSRVAETSAKQLTLPAPSEDKPELSLSLVEHDSARNINMDKMGDDEIKSVDFED